MKVYRLKDGAYQFGYTMDGKQKQFYCGIFHNAASAVRVAGVVKELLGLRYRRESPSRQLVKRIGELPEKCRETILRHGLFSGRGLRLCDLITMHRETKADLSASAINRYEGCYLDMEAFFGKDKLIEKITAADAERFRVWLLTKRSIKAGPLSVQSVERAVRCYRNVFEFAIDSEMIDRNPFRKVRSGPSINEEKQYHVERSDMTIVLEYCRDDLERFMMLLARFAGLRIPCEIRHMTYGDFRADTFDVDPKTKTGRRTVPFFWELRETFGRLRKGKKKDDLIFPETWTNGKNANKRAIRIVTRSGVDVWPKMFVNMRGSCITDYENMGYPEKILDEIFGNSSQTRRRHYVQFRERHDIERMLEDNRRVFGMHMRSDSLCDDKEIMPQKCGSRKSSLKIFEPEFFPEK